MKVIIPLAGKGTRLRPHTHTRAKPLLRLAGNTVLGHILDQLDMKQVDEIIFVIGHLGAQIQEYITANYKVKARFVEQKEMKGQADAIYLTKDYVDSDALIIFVDTLFDAKEARINELHAIQEDGAIFVKSVPDPRRFGVVVADKKGIVTKLIEKPEVPVSNLVNIGLYYVKDTKLMFESIEELFRKNQQLGGEYYLMDAFQIMIDHGCRFKTVAIDTWLDCGKPETMLSTNQVLLEKIGQTGHNVENSVIIRPVFIEDTAVVRNSILGPYVSVAAGAVIENAIIRDSIIDRKAVIKDSALSQSLVGEEAVIKDSFRKLNVGDHCQVEFEK